MHTNRRTTVAAAVALALLLTSACGDDDDGATTASSQATSEGQPEPETIPDGTYERVITMADAEALSIEPAFAEDFLGADGEVPVAVEFDGDRWRHLVTNDIGDEEVADLGRLSYDDDGNLVTVSTSDGCPGCTGVIEWLLDGEELTLRFATTGGEQVPDDARLAVEGTYRRRTGTTEEATSRTIAVANYHDDTPEEIVAYLSEVEQLVGDAVAWDLENSYGGTTPVWTTAEAEALADVTSGKIDAAIVGARAVPGLEALIAPLLIDSYELQDEVFTAGIAQQALEGVDIPEVVAVAIMPGPMRKLLGAQQAFTTPDDFAGRRLAGDAHPLAEATARALGATSVPGRVGQPLAEFDALNAHVAAVTGNGYDRTASALTVNVNLWPRPLVLVMNRSVHDALPANVRQALATAGTNAAMLASEETQRIERISTDALCSSPIDVIEASSDDLAALDASVAPVREQLRSNPVLAQQLDAINALRARLAASPSSISCP